MRPIQTWFIKKAQRDASSPQDSRIVLPVVADKGLTTVYDPSGEDDVVADVIFVHGLMGHPFDTWTHGERSQGSENSKVKGSKSVWSRKRSEDEMLGNPQAAQVNEECYWPFDLLHKDFPNIRIMTYGYDSSPLRSYPRPTNQMSIRPHGVQLFNSVTSHRVECSTRPIIFVAHSLGGILVKGAIIESEKYKRYQNQPEMQEVANFTRATFFFGTPHHGADAAAWGSFLGNVVRAIPGARTIYNGL